MTSVCTGKFKATKLERFKLQIRATLKNGERGSAFNEFTSTDSRYIFAKEEFRSEDVLADAENATECCNPGNSKPNQHT